jgi:hypothetical protein
MLNTTGTFANLNFRSEIQNASGEATSLAAVDPNASTASNRALNANSTKRKATERTENTAQAHNLIAKRHRRAKSPVQNATAAENAPRTLYVTRLIKKEDIRYQMKDNSVLRRLLSERDLSIAGTRDEMIVRLEDSCIDYESIPKGQLTEMLRNRNVSLTVRVRGRSR